MAVNPSTKWPTRTTAVAPAYPYGSSKDETTPGANDGTPYEKARADDIFGFQQALLKFAGIVPSGNADTAQASQYLQALLDVAMGGGFFEDGGAANTYLFNVLSGTDRQGPAVYTDGMKVSAVIVNTNTGASTVNVNSLGVKNIFYKGAALTAGMLTVGETVFLIYDGASGRFNLWSSTALFMDLFSAQSIAGDKTFTADLKITNVQPALKIFETGVTAENGNWHFVANGETFLFMTRNDADNAGSNVFEVYRTGTTVDTINFKPTALQHNGDDVITVADSASETAKGIVELATDAEVAAGTDTDRAVTPAGLASTQVLVPKIIDIGDWDMDTVGTVSVPHGLVAANIRAVSVSIRDNAGLPATDFPAFSASGTTVEYTKWDATDILMFRSASGLFDNANYNSTSFNRGWITIWYKP